VASTVVQAIQGDPSPGFFRFLLHFFYDSVWALAFLVCSPWWITRGLFDARFRKLSIQRTFGRLPPRRVPGGRERILIHGVSVGEIKAAKPLIEALERDYEIVLSTTTDTGMAVAAQLYPRHALVRFPLDFSPLVQRLLGGVDPCLIVLVELELWPSFLRVANRRRIPIAVVNGRITERSFPRYRLFKPLLPQFTRISLFCAQDEEYAARFRALGAAPERVIVTGNIKADGLRTGERERKPELTALLAPKGRGPTLVAGSTHAPEERLIIEAWRSQVPDARLILVPRHPARAEELERELPELQRLTRLRAGEKPDPSRPVLVDTIGELEAVYALADLVIVGGSFLQHGGQNMLEPAAQGKPCVYGPHVGNFLQESALLERVGAAVRVAGAAELGPVLGALLADQQRMQAMGESGMQAVETQKGASARTLEALRRVFLANL
jgi:3-deoxy-D-manno-octulosonic-acid transferase